MILCRHPQTIILVINFIYQKMDSLVHEKEAFRVSAYHKLWCSFVINNCDMLLFTSQVTFTSAFIKFALSKLVKDKNHSCFFSKICCVIIKLRNMLFRGFWSGFDYVLSRLSPILHAIMLPCSCFEKSSNVDEC